MIWVPIKQAPKYEVSETGYVRNTKTKKVLKPRSTKKGYLRVHLHKVDFYIHRLVADAFCVHPVGCNVINHIDNNPQNNNANNLEWVTQFYNVHYGMKQGRYKFNAVGVVGCKEGHEQFYPSAHYAQKETGCDHSMIIKCCKGKKKTTHGFTWRYAEV